MNKNLVIIPSYNTGGRLRSTVGDVLQKWSGPVWVVIDGSTDKSDAALEREHGGNPRLRIIRRMENHGKGAAVMFAAHMALGEDFTHACTFDADGQHCAADIDRLFASLPEDGAAFVLGVPIFGPDAPAERVKGRRVGNTFAKLETLWRGPEDSLYGMRVYPLKNLARVMHNPFIGRRYDFDTEAAVRLVWSGTCPINFKTPVLYLTRAQGGISHFNYLRDNFLLTLMHTRLLLELPFHIPSLIANSRRWRSAPATKA
jgi:glycosyltransferase involved in cell wall biosynthesis